VPRVGDTWFICMPFGTLTGGMILYRGVSYAFIASLKKYGTAEIRLPAVQVGVVSHKRKCAAMSRSPLGK